MLRTKNWTPPARLDAARPPATGDPIIHPVFDGRIINRNRNSYNESQTKKLDSLRNKNEKEYWKLLKSAYTKRISKTKANVNISTFEKCFKSINNPESNFYQPDEDVLYFNSRIIDRELQVMFDELNIPFSAQQILSACSEIKNNRSVGPDIVINEFFKYGSMQLERYINSLFNKIFDMGYFPLKWFEEYMIRLFNKGDPEKPENYRGITLLSTLGKLMTRILNNRLNNWAEYYHVYVEAKAGFRKNMGAVDNIFIVHGLINKFIGEKKKLYVCFVDFTKAFDLLK